MRGAGVGLRGGAGEGERRQEAMVMDVIGGGLVLWATSRTRASRSWRTGERSCTLESKALWLSRCSWWDSWCSAVFRALNWPACDGGCPQGALECELESVSVLSWL